MEVYEEKKLNNKKLEIFLMKKETTELTDSEFLFLNDLARSQGIDFFSSDINENTDPKNNPFTINNFTDEFNKPFLRLDIPAFAKGYLQNEIDEKKQEVKELKAEYERLEPDTFKAQNLKAWIDLLEDEIKEKEDFLRTKIRPQWIVNKLFDQLRDYNRDYVKILHFTNDQNFKHLKNKLETLKIKVHSIEAPEPIIDQLEDEKHLGISKNKEDESQYIHTIQ